MEKIQDKLRRIEDENQGTLSELSKLNPIPFFMLDENEVSGLVESPENEIKDNAEIVEKKYNRSDMLKAYYFGRKCQKLYSDTNKDCIDFATWIKEYNNQDN